MFEKISNLDFLADIKKSIDEHGVYIFGVNFLAPNLDEKVVGRKINQAHYNDCLVYSIGHNERHRPDFLFYSGSRESEKPFTKVELDRRIDSASLLINHLVDNWDQHPIQTGDTCEDRDGRVYYVAGFIPKGTPHFVKQFTTLQANHYYGSFNYDLLILMPSGWAGSLPPEMENKF